MKIEVVEVKEATERRLRERFTSGEASEADLEVGHLLSIIDELRGDPPPVPARLARFVEPVKVLDRGHVRLVSVMGDDSSIVQAARVSYGKGTKTTSDDRTLIRYMMRHGHCYHPTMQVLTTAGWLRWNDCRGEETFLVPDPKTRTLSPETLQVEAFDFDDEMCVFENERMSYSVTPEHRMWFRGKYQNEYGVVRAEEMQKWGHFDPLIGYKAPAADAPASPLGRLIGFTLGDGSWEPSGGIRFHLRKQRKKAYLCTLLGDLGHTASESPSATYPDATVFYLSAGFVRSTGMLDYVLVGERAVEKKLSNLNLTPSLIAGIFDGLVNSDGSTNDDRNDRVEFSSASSVLVEQFAWLAAQMGYDGHRHAGGQDDVGRVTAYPAGRTSLEARKEYFRKEYHSGKVYCTTTSTGLLIVRGGPDKFAFVCGNSSPFEMCEIKLHIKMPMDHWRQQIRQRTANVNEYSTRYSEAIDDIAATEPGAWRRQSTANKQGSGGLVTEWPEGMEVPYDHAEGRAYNTRDATPGEYLSMREANLHRFAREVYEERLAFGVAREQARKDLPLSNYTEAYWKIDLHNLFHYLEKRLAPDAQQEIRAYARAIADIVAEWCPVAWEAFTDYRLDARTVSGPELRALRGMLANRGFCEEYRRALDAEGVTNARERAEALAKLGWAP